MPVTLSRVAIGRKKTETTGGNLARSVGGDTIMSIYAACIMTSPKMMMLMMSLEMTSRSLDTRGTLCDEAGQARQCSSDIWIETFVILLGLGWEHIEVMMVFYW